MEAGPVVLGGSHNTDPVSVTLVCGWLRAQRALHAQDSPAVPPAPTGGDHLPRTQQQQQQREVLHSLAARGDNATSTLQGWGWHQSHWGLGEGFSPLCVWGLLKRQL